MSVGRLAIDRGGCSRLRCEASSTPDDRTSVSGPESSAWHRPLSCGSMAGPKR
jgi:hypothetical protein